ncbi:MAG: cytochrome c biogenesis protein CcsA [Victivallales bacterium]|jgi:ABC-type transport system involved in cytochrome c biogenesis permease subunit
MTSLVIIKILLVVSISAYILSALFYGLKRGKYGIALFAAGWVGSVAVFLINWIEAVAPPFGNMYQVQVFLSICFLPLYMFLSRRDNLGWTGIYFAAASGLSLLGAFFMSPDITWKRMPALQSPWFVPHVTSYMISYALATVAFIMYLVGKVRGKAGNSSDSRYEQAVYVILGVAFPFMTFGMLSGALWAEEAWGNYWSWDRKETWSLITWTLYLVYFHCLTKKNLMKYAGLVQVLAFLALITTFFLVNLWPKLSSVMHSYSS